LATDKGVVGRRRERWTDTLLENNTKASKPAVLNAKANLQGHFF